MAMSNTKMENRYWTNNLIIHEMKLLERYPSDNFKVTGRMKTLSQYHSSYRRARGFDVVDNEKGFLPSVHRYSHGQCQVSKREYFWKGQFNYDGDNDDNDDDDDDSIDSNKFELDNQFHLPGLQVTPSKNANCSRGDFYNIPPIHKSKFMISYNSKNDKKSYDYENEDVSTPFNELNSGNEYRHSSEMHYKYKNRNGFVRQHALSSEEDDELQKHGGYNNKHLFSKASKNGDPNCTHSENRRRTKDRKHKTTSVKNTGKANGKFGHEYETDSDGHNDGEWVESDEGDNAKAAGEKGLKSDNESAATRKTKQRNHKSPLTTKKNTNRKHQVLQKKKMEEEPVAKKLVDNKGVYQNTQKRILKWMSHNYGRVIDVFKKFDVDNSGSLSMEEFYQGMKELGAPGTQVELYMMAKALDRDGDESIDYQEFRKIRSLYKKSAGKRTRGGHAHLIEDNHLPKLQPCSKCCIGITEPATQNKHQRHISVRMSSTSHEPTRKSSIEPFVFDVSPETTVYGIQQLTKAELGGSATNVRIFRRRDKRSTEVLEQHKTLGDYGYDGNIRSDNPEIVMLFYDYTYPALDCPLVSASLSR